MRKLFQNLADYIRETDKILLILCTITSLFGCAMVYSATRFTGSSRQFIVQLGSMFIGLIAAIIISTFDYKRISKWIVLYILLAASLLAVTYIFGFAPDGTENKAWLKLPFGMTLQPSELIKIIMMITFSKHVQAIDKREINKFSNVMLLAIHALSYPVAVMALQKDLGTVSVMAFIALIMLYCAGIKKRYFAVGGVLAVIGLPILWIYGLGEYQKSRFTILFDLYSDAKGKGYQQIQGLSALGSGGLFGAGYLQGPKTQNQTIPKAHNDFIFTAAGEELGLIGCLAIILLLLCIILRIVRVGGLSRDRQGFILCMGAFAMFAAQTIINLGMCLALMPVIGVTLPFFSAGGTSLVCLFLCIGLVLSVFKNRNKRQMYLRDKG